MKKRQWAIIGGVAVLALAILLFFLLSGSSEQSTAAQKPPVKGVEVIRISNDSVPVTVQMDGKLNALEKIEIYAEVNGILQPGGKKFEEGIPYKKGETLLRLENSEARSNYLAAKSQFVNTISQVLPDIKIDYPEAFETWRGYLSDVSDADYVPAPPEPQNDQLRLFLVGRQVYSNYQNLESARVRLNKFTVKAPFNGVVTEALVDPGVLVRAGQRLGEFLDPGRYELETAVSSGELELINVGDSVSLTSPDMSMEWKGVLFRINAKIDPNTQQVKVFIRVEAEELKDGMFLNAEIDARKVESAFELDRSLIYNDTYTYVVQDSTLRRRKLDIIRKNPKTIIARGLPDGTLVPDQPISGAYEGMEVRVVNPSGSSTDKDTTAENRND